MANTSVKRAFEWGGGKFKDVGEVISWNETGGACIFVFNSRAIDINSYKIGIE